MSDQKWQDNFKLRCQAVGWRVETSKSNHNKVFSRSGQLLLTYSGTPSDRRTMLNVLGQAKRAGLEQLEADQRLAAERDRLTRIEVDRTSNGHVESRVTPPVFVAPVTSDAAPFPATAEPRSELGLGQVDGVAIVAVAPAKTQTPVMAQPAPLANAEELLLADGRVLYRCLKPQPLTGNPCHRTFETVNSVRAHIIHHARTAGSLRDRDVEPVKPVKTTKVAKPVKPVKPREKSSVTTTASPVSASGEPPTESPASDRASVTQLQRRVTAITEALELISNGVRAVSQEVSEIQCELNELQVTSAETLRKAEQFDNLKAMLS
jgi:hypothetical protein